MVVYIKYLYSLLIDIRSLLEPHREEVRLKLSTAFQSTRNTIPSQASTWMDTDMLVLLSQYMLFNVLYQFFFSFLYCLYVFQVFVSVKGVNGAGLSTVATSNGVYISYLSQGRPPLSPIGVIDIVNGERIDV